MAIRCNKCGYYNEQDARFCEKCGEKLLAPTVSLNEWQNEQKQTDQGLQISSPAQSSTSSPVQPPVSPPVPAPVSENQDIFGDWFGPRPPSQSPAPGPQQMQVWKIPSQPSQPTPPAESEAPVPPSLPAAPHAQTYVPPAANVPLVPPAPPTPPAANTPAPAPVPAPVIPPPPAAQGTQEILSKAPQACPHCQRALMPNARFCDNCGRPVIAIPTCPNCGTRVVENAKFCHNCGTMLMARATAPAVPAPVAPIPPPAAVPTSPPPAPALPPTPPKPQSMDLLDFLHSPTVAANDVAQAKGVPPIPPKVFNPRLQIHPNGTILTLPRKEGPILIGRSDTERGLQADVDLTPFEGKRLGVSRRHSHLYRVGDSWQIEDLNTPNFTEVNGNRVMPGDIVTLQNGDELRFGDLFARFLLD